MMRNVVALLCTVLLVVPQARAWMTDLKLAQDRAYAENRLVLINFTGSDWCGWCIKLKNEVFNTSEFNAFAERHLMLVEIDFPSRKFMSPQQRAANKTLANHYGVQGYPTVVVLNSKGNEVGRLGYKAGGPSVYVKELRRIGGLAGANSSRPGESYSPPPAFGGAKVGPPPKYTALTLKSISGTGSKKLALINNQTFALGETAKVRLGDGEVKVRLEEIRDKSVIVIVEGKGRKELGLNQL